LGGADCYALLAAIFSLIGAMGAVIGVQIMGVDAGSFWSQMRAVWSQRHQRGHREELHFALHAA